MANLVQNPYPIFTDADGNPLEDGFIFIGDPGLSPITNPLQAYWDSALTIPANAIRTKGGYPANSGTPGRLYTASNYSIVVQDKRGATIYTQGNAIDFFVGATEMAVQGVAGEDIDINEIVYFSTDGFLYIADSSDTAKSTVAGVSVSNVLAGAVVTAQRSGILTTFSGVVVGSSYYLGNSGTVVLKSTLTAYDAVIFIGVATTLSAIDLNIHGDIAPPLKIKIINIGDWDMVATPSVSIAHGLTLSTIREVKATIRTDDDDDYFTLPKSGTSNEIDGNVTGTDVTTVDIARRAGGTFANTFFDSTSYNRGWIIIRYVG